MTRRLILLGGGHTHLHVLRALAHQPLPSTRAVLVTPTGRQFYSGMLPGLVAGHYTAQACAVPLAPLAAAAGLPLIEASAVRIDSAARRVWLSNGQSEDYDLLSIDTGAVIHADAIPGAAQHALFVRPIEAFVATVASCFARPAQRAQQAVVIGGGAAGVELAMAWAHRLRGGGQVTLLTGGPVPMAGYPPAVLRRVARALDVRGVRVLRQACVAITAEQVQLADGSRLACDAALLATGVSAPRWLAGSGLALDPQGFISTVATLQSVSHAEVFAVGDVASRSDVQHPKSGVYAVRAGPPLALNLRRWVEGRPLVPHRPQQRTLNLVSCGNQHAIAAWGRWSTEGGWVWRWKDRIDRGFVARNSKANAEQG